ncbi:3,4-dihydroxy-2-butanone-4-phosphate synthase [Mycobacterium florentinum]|uniref:3,4-dihydroxy-2-butanone-4-phosphate synthase n=1 Tax=Mycobacterium florentinum TaxID=292462 RepID=UPI000A14EF13|nr:3,4-dihydroxy-2-butanone-4-phosphate synthase [Mycobacterium florentinum]
MGNPHNRRVRVARALDDLRAGRPILIFGEPVTPGGAPATLVFAAQYATTATLAFVIRHTCGFVCIALPDRECDRLILPAMSTLGARLPATQFRVSVDAADGVTTGISAADRAHTMRVLSDPTATHQALTRPGHVVVCGVAGRALSRPLLPEHAALKMVAAAGLRPAAGFSAIVNDIDHDEILPAEMVDRFVAEHDLSMISMADLWGQDRLHNCTPEPRCHARPLGIVQTQSGAFNATGYRWGSPHHVEDLVFTFGDLAGAAQIPVAVHAECAFAPIPDVLGCQCGPRLNESFDQIAAAGRGVLVYLRSNAEALCPVSAASRRDHILATIGLSSVHLLRDNACGAQRCIRLESPDVSGLSTFSR